MREIYENFPHVAKSDHIFALSGSKVHTLSYPLCKALFICLIDSIIKFVGIPVILDISSTLSSFTLPILIAMINPPFCHFFNITI